MNQQVKVQSAAERHCRFFFTDLKMLVVDGITEQYRPCAVNAAKSNDAIKLQVFEANKHARTFQYFVNT